MEARDKRRWEGIIINIEEGDILTSKKGILSKTAILGRMVTNKRMKYLGKGIWECLDEPTEIKDIKEVS